MSTDSVNPSEYKSANVDASGRFSASKTSLLTTDRGDLSKSEGYKKESAGVHARGNFPIGKTASPTTDKKWATIAEETKHTSRTLDALDLAGRTTSEEARVKVSRSLAALDLAVRKVQEANFQQMTLTSDPSVKKAKMQNIIISKKVREALQPAREAIDAKHEVTPTPAPSAPTLTDRSQSIPSPTLTK